MFPDPIQTGIVIKLDENGCLDEGCHLLNTTILEEKRIKVFPNPSIDEVNIESNKPIVSVSIINLLGQEVYNKQLNAFSSTLNISSLDSGIYLIKIHQEDGNLIEKKIMKR